MAAILYHALPTRSSTVDQPPCTAGPPDGVAQPATISTGASAIPLTVSEKNNQEIEEVPPACPREWRSAWPGRANYQAKACREGRRSPGATARRAVGGGLGNTTTSGKYPGHGSSCAGRVSLLVIVSRYSRGSPTIARAGRWRATSSDTSSVGGWRNAKPVILVGSPGWSHRGAPYVAFEMPVAAPGPLSVWNRNRILASSGLPHQFDQMNNSWGLRSITEQHPRRWVGGLVPGTRSIANRVLDGHVPTALLEPDRDGLRWPGKAAGLLIQGRRQRDLTLKDFSPAPATMVMPIREMSHGEQYGTLNQ